MLAEFSIFSLFGLLKLLLIFVLVIGGSFCLPGGFEMVLSSGALTTNVYDLLVIYLVAISAAIIGDVTVFLISRKFSANGIRILSRFNFFTKNHATIKKLLSKRGFLIIFFTRFGFIPLSAPVNYISGIEMYDKAKFIRAVIYGDIIYGTFYPTLGFIFRETWSDLSNLIKDIIGILILIVIITILLNALFSHVKNRRRNNINKAS